MQILEEAGLQPDQVQLVRSGRPLVVDDGELAACGAAFGAPQAWGAEQRWPRVGLQDLLSAACSAPTRLQAWH